MNKTNSVALCCELSVSKLCNVKFYTADRGACARFQSPLPPVSLLKCIETNSINEIKSKETIVNDRIINCSPTSGVKAHLGVQKLHAGGGECGTIAIIARAAGRGRTDGAHVTLILPTEEPPNFITKVHRCDEKQHPLMGWRWSFAAAAGQIRQA